MSFKKKDLEIVYSLRWKNGPKRDDKKQISIVAVYDIPATTLNFKAFKSYLLKNSGTAEKDVNVFYIMDNGKEYPVHSHTDFQVALYAFRRKARAGEMIHLLLERISDQPVHKNLRHSNDAETQFDNMEQNSIVSTCCNADVPPDWFIAGLAQLKKDIKEDVTANVSSIVADAVADIRSYAVCTHGLSHRIRGWSKPEKRLRKISSHAAADVSDVKDMLKKSLKFENKIEKLERKACKYREKRSALQYGPKSSDNGPKSSDSEAGPSSRTRPRDKEEKRRLEEQQKANIEEPQKPKGDEEPKMDARPFNVQTSIPHLLGGEVYLHQWQVQNTGQGQWTSMTQLQYTWGSKKLVPIEKSILVPYLKPGEKGTISARLQIPTQSGKYECYWQFTHKGRRFGHWLGVQVIVDSFDLKGHSSVLEKTSPLDLDDSYRHSSESEEIQKLLRPYDSDTPKKALENGKSAEALVSFYKPTDNGAVKKNVTEQLAREVSDDPGKLRLRRKPSLGIMSGATDLFDGLERRPAINDEIDSDCCSWTSEPTHFWSQVDENGEFVVVPVPQCFVLDTPESSDNNLVKKEGTPSRKEEKPAQPDAGKALAAVASKDPKADATIDNFDDNNNTESVSGASGGSIKLRDEELDNIVVITVPKDDQIKEGYIYVHVDGQKVLIPKNILKSEVVSAAQELERSPSATNSVGVIIGSNESLNNKSPTPSVASTITGSNSLQPEAKKGDDHSGNALDSAPPKTLEEPIVPLQAPVDLSTATRESAEYPLDDTVDRSNYFEANNYMSHCSAAGSCYSEINSSAERQNRLFIFPQDVPGYEVVYPVLDMNDPDCPNLATETFVPQDQVPNALHEGYNIPMQQLQQPNPFVEPVANYQQTPPELRRAPTHPLSDPLLHGEPCLEAQSPAGLEYACANAQQQQQQQQQQRQVYEQHRVYEADVQPARTGVNQEAASSAIHQVHLLPETLVTGAVNVASSALNTARSVINMIKPQSPGRWVNGHWVSSSPETPRETNLQALAEMGFWNRDLNATLLARFNDDLNRVVAELVQ